MKTIIAAALFLLALPAAAQAPAPATVAATFDDMIAKGSRAPQDLLFLYLADKVSSSTVVHSTEPVAPGSVNSSFIAAGNATRTDMHIGAAANAPGATSLIDKAGAADLLALALERGAVSQETDGTAVTLSTTPYLLAGFIGVRDSPANWKNYASLRHIAISATFADQAAVDAGDFGSVQSGQVKWTILGNRSPRDAALLDSFLAVASQPVQAADALKNVTCSALTTQYLQQIAQVANALPAANAAALRSTLDSMFAATTFTPAQRVQIAACGSATVDAEIKADGAAAKLNAMTEAYLALNAKKQLSLAVSSQRDTTIDDYATVKILYAYDTAPKITINLNAEGNFNQHYQHKDLHQVRSFSVELGSTFGRFSGNRFDATTSAKIWRNNDTANRNVSVVQVKGNVYLTNTYILPVSISYANEAVENVAKGWQFNIGIASLLDSLLAKPLGQTQ
jgi:hypothetical protein